MMARIAEVTEAAQSYRERMAQSVLAPAHGATDAITEATCLIAAEVEAKAICPSTSSGYTARMIARRRPMTPTLVITPSEAVRQELALVWGVQPVVVKEYRTTDEMIARAEAAVAQAGLAQPGDTVVITAGIPLGGRGRTNMLKIHVVGSQR